MIAQEIKSQETAAEGQEENEKESTRRWTAGDIRIGNGMLSPAFARSLSVRDSSCPALGTSKPKRSCTAYSGRRLTSV